MLSAYHRRKLVIIVRIFVFLDMSDVEHETTTPPPPSNATLGDIENRHSALNYAQLASSAAAQNVVSDPNCSSTETLLRNIQGLLKVAADNARQQERQISYEKGNIIIDFSIL